MAHKRSNFSEKDKAEIFVRDHATCAFSGKSLWLLDYGATPLWEYDWVDHIKPSARQGKATHDNGICASYTFNSKKGANSRDRTYFFQNGSPTENHYDYFNVLPGEMRRQLIRLSGLHTSDWYFNRCLLNACEGLQIKYENERPRPKWGVRSCYNAAWNKLQDYQRLARGVPSMEARKILMDPDRADVKALLRLRGAETKADFVRQLNSLYPTYANNCDHYYNFWVATSQGEMDKALQAAETNSKCSHMVIKAIQSHHAFFTSCGTLPSQRDS